MTPLRGIREKINGAKVLYAQGCELAEGMPTYKTIPAHTLFNGSNAGLKGEYFNSTDFTGTPSFVLTDSLIDMNWSDKAPRNDMNDDNFAVRWSGELVPDKTASYQLGFISTCNTRLYLDDSLVAKTIYHFRDEYGDPRLRKSPVMKLEAGRKYKIVLEAIDTYADAQVQLVWTSPQPDLKREAVDVAKKADAVVMFMGLTARMEGEEMDIKIDGFSAGDRTRIDLPDTQQDLIKTIHALGKPVVLVLLNGSALAVNWESKNVPAILEAWYPGQAAGQAIADVLFGDYNPSGRLPVTFYRSANDLPSFKEYNVVGQTYRYFKGEPLYSFGYGLSYTTFEYSDLTVVGSPKAGYPVTLSVTVKNSGKMKGDEVVQVYVRNTSRQSHSPIRSLAGFNRVTLDQGESKQLQFELSPDAFSRIDENGNKVAQPAEYEIAVGGGQPDQRNVASIKTVVSIK
jgi:beta-glucosidase